MREVVRTTKAPAAVGPYSQGIVCGGFVWASGQIGMKPDTGAVVQGSIEDETRQVLANLSAVLEAAHSSLDRVVRATVFLADLDDFDRVNRVWAEVFGSAPPARVCLQVSRLPRGARIEVDAVAEVG